MTKTKLDSGLIAVTKPHAPEHSVVKGSGYRITVLTDRLFRIETSKTNSFIDEATQAVWFRNLETPKFKADKNGDTVKITTDKVTLVFNAASGAAKIVFENGTVAACNNAKNLKGTMRTLDGNFGVYMLGLGIMSRTGVAVLNDDSLILNSAGEVEARNADTLDRYIFAYGNDYRGALKDFYRITGGVPLIPRFALGNWWSRYRAYTQQEYVNLMQKFIDRDVPLTVATVDMDWHWVNVNERFGTDYPKRKYQSPGWTGYSWNTDLFPDYKGFLKWLNENNLKVTLNLHPADGIRHYEDMYGEMAEAMDIDPETKTDIPFNMTDNRFINSYFKVVNKKYEEEGVRFWWIDWQQGTKSALTGLDPLWSLNHYFTLDNARNYRPLILSRYAGVGSHRYPLGFSGDTFSVWSSLKKQPYFTNNAANIGYTWWSHDIGGHMMGVRDDEMYLRWLQYGVFSPVNRLHSTSNDLMGKEPWSYRSDICHYAEEALKFRHKLIPYIYTMNYLTYSEGRAVCEPMYYAYPDEAEAYKIKNQYMFGTELMVCPIVAKTKKSTGTAAVKIWLPAGRWTDIFTGQIYTGSKRLKLFRDIASVPVLAKEGAVIPLSLDKGNRADNPADMEILVFRGNNSFTLYEDEGEDNSYAEIHAKTKMTVSEDGGVAEFCIHGAEGSIDVLPAERSYKINFKDIESGRVSVRLNDKIISTEIYNNQPIVDVKSVKCTDKVCVTITDYTIKANINGSEAVARVMSKWQNDNILKSLLYSGVKKRFGVRGYREAVKKSLLPKTVKEEIYEYLDS